MKTILSGLSAFSAQGDVMGSDHTALAGSAHFSRWALSWNLSSQRALSTTFSKPPNHSFVVAIPRIKLHVYDALAAPSAPSPRRTAPAPRGAPPSDPPPPPSDLPTPASVSPPLASGEASTDAPPEPIPPAAAPASPDAGPPSD